MIKKDSVNTLRLKYKNRFVVVKLIYEDVGLVNVSVSAPVTPAEKSSFNKVSSTISKLVYSGIRSRRSILGKLERMVGVEQDVLIFMLKVFRDHVILE
ncbi:MAG: hypothetical protein KAS32_06470 [Candidatus Peribacteraceae bacterium]|nr:hypothetical protein [Candidatus Peribacteraceae bacterium]